ncbi:MAG: class I SAM-dependent methyltransferase [Candidatus Aminicenantes bacterium]|nr:MAG: class I SAM-dependent methyltransferase [Candidatus Aminicenantes bacterium]
MVYGKHFARIYDAKWTPWGKKLWPFLFKVVREKRPEAETWLDVCCGTGSLLEYVCKRGFSGVGVDNSRHQIKIAKSNVSEAKFYTQDIRSLSLSQKFDVITCTYDSLNYLTVKRDLERAFCKISSHLNPDGIFIFDMNTYEGLQDQWSKTFTVRDPSMTIIVESSFDSKREIGQCIITGFLKEGRLFRKFEEIHIERGYRSAEIEQLLTKTGFSFRKYDGNTLKRPKKRSGRLLYICHRRLS